MKKLAIALLLVFPLVASGGTTVKRGPSGTGGGGDPIGESTVCTEGQVPAATAGGVWECAAAPAAGDATFLNQDVNEVDLRYDATANKYYYDVNGDSIKGVGEDYVAPPGGSNGQVQYNNAGSLAGSNTYIVSSVSEAQAAIDACGSDLLTAGVDNPIGCIVEFTQGVFENNNTTLVIGGDGDPNNGQAGIILRGSGGSGVAGSGDRSARAGTTIRATGTNPIIEIGACTQCKIEDLMLDGDQLATVGIDFLAPGSVPTTHFVARDMHIQEIDGYAIRTAATGQVDNLLFENITIRYSTGCYQQRYSQNVGVVFQNSTCAGSGVPGDVMFDIQQGDIIVRDSFWSIKNNEVGFRFGNLAGKAVIDGNQIEFGTSTTGVALDFNEGVNGVTDSRTISNNRIVHGNGPGNTFIDFSRRGSLTMYGNMLRNVAGPDFLISTIRTDPGALSNILIASLFSNTEGGPWTPTIVEGPPSVTLTARQFHATDCTAVKGGVKGQLCWELDSNAVYGCEMDQCDGAGWVVSTGDVVGPASSTTNGVAIFADETGKLLADSSVTVATGNVTAAGFFSSTAGAADTGLVRLANAETVCWEASPAGTDVCLSVDANEELLLGTTTLVGGDTGSTDNSVLRANGTGGTTLQSSACTIDDNGVNTCPGGFIASCTPATQSCVIGFDLESDALAEPVAGQGVMQMNASGLVETRINGAATKTLLQDPGSGGFCARTATGVCTSRSLTAGLGIDVNNPTGASDNPEILVETRVRTGVCSFPFQADSSGALTHIDTVARCYIPDAATLVRVYGSTSANTATFQLFERAEGSPNTGTTGLLNAAIVLDTGGEVTTSFADAAIASDSVIVLDVTAETLGASESGFIAVEYQLQ